jgi:transcriptional regulator with XRE-family HTH domain
MVTKHAGLHIAANLKKYRKAQKYTQAQAAQHMGMARTTIVAIEQGKRPPITEELEQFAALYGVAVADITHVVDIPADTPSMGVIHIYYGYSVREADKGEKCFYCGAKEKRFAYTYFGAPVCKPCWDNTWRQGDEGKTDPPFDDITREASGEWVSS